MLYTDLLKTITGCPFCASTNQIMKENDGAFLTYAVAPYAKNHLLVVPKRHTTSFLNLTQKENKDIEELLRHGAKLLEFMQEDDYSILVRNGDGVGKSVAHLHYHIVPKIVIGNTTYDGGDREVLTQEEIDAFMKEYQEIKNLIV